MRVSIFVAFLVFSPLFTHAALSHRELARGWVAMMNGHGDGSSVLANNIELLDDMMTPNKPTKGRTQVLKLVAHYRHVFPDLHFSDDFTVGSLGKDKFVAQWKVTATHSNEFMGIAPRGKGKQDHTGAIEFTLNAQGKISHQRGFHSQYLLERIGGINAAADLNAMAEQTNNFWNNKSDDLSLYALDIKFIDHVNMAAMNRDAAVVGQEALIQLRNMYYQAFSDLHFPEFESTTLDGDKFFIMWRATGTHTGPLMGIPATGKAFDIRGVNLVTLRAGKISEMQVNHGRFLLEVLGVMPDMPLPAQSDKGAEL